MNFDTAAIHIVEGKRHPTDTLGINEVCQLSHPLEIIEHNGRPWVLADEDLYQILCFNIAMFDHELYLPWHDWLRAKVRSGDTETELRLVSEAGLYKLLLVSSAEEAKRFVAWLADDLLLTVNERIDEPKYVLLSDALRRGCSFDDPKMRGCLEELTTEVLPDIRNDPELHDLLKNRLHRL